MMFAGLAFGQLLAIFGALGAAITALYILKLKRRAVVVPFSPLWDRILGDKNASSLFSKLRRLLSLLLQLALLALLLLSLGDPKPEVRALHGRTMVVLVDASASMQAMDVLPSRFEVARQKVTEIVSSMSATDRALVAQVDVSVTPLGPLTSDRSALLSMASELRPTESRIDPARALRFAADSLRGYEHPEIVIISDGHFPIPDDPALRSSLANVDVKYVAVGSAGANVGITQFSVRRYPLDKARYEVMLEVTNASSTPADVELRLLGDGIVVDITKLRLAANERLPRFYPNLSGASQRLEAQLLPLAGTIDNLLADNRAFALLPERRRAKVTVVTEGNTYLEAALLLDEYLEVTELTPRKFAERGSPPGTEIVIFDRVTPLSQPSMHAMYIDPQGDGSPVKIGRELKSPGFDKVDHKHPIVRYLSLDDVNVAKGHALTPALGDKTVGSSEGNAILVAGTRGAHKFVAVGFDLRESDLPLRIAWPLFLMNTLQWFSDEEANYLSSFRTGDVWRVSIPGTASRAKLSHPDGRIETVAVHEGRAVLEGTRAGFFSLLLETPDATPILFAANLSDEQETHIAPEGPPKIGDREAVPLSIVRAPVQQAVWVYLLIAAILVTAFEWITYHRRVTV